MQLIMDKICKPATTAKSDNNTPRGTSATTVQCRGITKSGTRCKHMTSLGNGFCFQHNPDK